MSIARSVRRAAALMKPKHGEPCNRCGVCCEASLCPLAARVFKMPEAAGPCPALSGSPGETTCGLVNDPARYMPVRTEINGVETMREAAQLLIGAGDGCDCRINGEPSNAAFDSRLLRLDELRRDRLESAWRLWT